MNLLYTSSGHLTRSPDIYVQYHFRREPVEQNKTVLFLLKDRTYNNVYAESYGLINSSKQIAGYLRDLDYYVRIEAVIDGNSIDRELHKYRPAIVIIEALWVPAYKLQELVSMHKYRNIKWIIRVHSEIGFLSAETNALQYINEYLRIREAHPNVHISFNSEKINTEMNLIYGSQKYDNSSASPFDYLPNIISVTKLDKHHHTKTHRDKHVISVGCFGSLRLMKNQVFQAMCAMRMANDAKKILHFHVNTQATNTNQINPILNNLRELFSNTPHRLIEHRWLNHDDFLNLIHDKIDIGMQLSYSESFNIVAADFVVAGVPILVSNAIDWLYTLKGSTTDYEDAVCKLKIMYWISRIPMLAMINKKLGRLALSNYNITAKQHWKRMLHNLLKGK